LTVPAAQPGVALGPAEASKARGDGCEPFREGALCPRRKDWTPLPHKKPLVRTVPHDELLQLPPRPIQDPMLASDEDGGEEVHAQEKTQSDPGADHQIVSSDLHRHQEALHQDPAKGHGRQEDTTEDGLPPPLGATNPPLQTNQLR